MKVAIVTDAWRPQVNGVVTTLTKTGETLEALGHTVAFVTPEPFATFPLPTYPDIRVALRPKRRTRQLLEDFAPHAVHIATEGPLGWAARTYCRARGLAFTTSYHTQFPQYVRLRAPVPVGLSYAVLRRFHAAAARTMVASESQRRELLADGFGNIVAWSRGVDTELFCPRDKSFLDAPRPVSMYLGRVAIEKNVEAFLSTALPGTRYVVGDGPDLEDLKRRYPAARFTGCKLGEELARYLAAADVLVFPSRTDTFGLVLLEAMACGVPVAAYPVTGPIDVVQDGITGALDADLGQAVSRALQLDGAAARAFAETRSWRAATTRFADNLSINERGERTPSVG